MFIAALFTTAQKIEATKISSVDEWVINCSIPDPEYYLTLKGNKLTSHEKTMEKIYMHITMKEASLKKAMLYGPNYMTS